MSRVTVEPAGMVAGVMTLPGCGRLGLLIGGVTATGV